jgi:hypothetical protein
MRIGLIVSQSIISLLFSLSILAQVPKSYSIPLNQRIITPTAGFSVQVIDQLNKSVAREITPSILQFNDIPNEKQKKSLLLNGIHLLSYLGGYAYIVSINQPLKAEALRLNGARTIYLLSDIDKINSSLRNVTADTTVHASIFPFISVDEAITHLNDRGFVTVKVYGDYPILKIHVPAGRLGELAHFNFIEYMEPPPPPPTELNYKSTIGTRANLLHLPNYNLNGEGIIFQVNEITGYPQDHIDFKDRSIGNKVSTSGAYHSTHVHGIIAGAGLVNELYKGYAPKATFNTSYVIDDPPNDLFTYGADLTNNSYASGSICPNSRTTVNLSLPSLVVDRQAIQFRSLIHVMSAGNSGTYQCPVFPLGYNTVYSGYQSAKSTLTVGATFTNGLLADFSSRGPGREGRFKPEIVAPGANIISTTPYNSYGSDNGTSMSGPAVVGGLGLLYQRYLQLHGTKPDNTLMKPLLCNSATDMGPAGPDYGYGFGFMNLNRAIQVLDGGNFYKDSVANQVSKTRAITVSPGIAKLKVMLYWQDPPGSPVSAKAIINDLDIKLTAPDGTTFLPFVLDTLPALVTNPARRGEDHINNIEQVEIDNPIAGNYTVSVNGYEIGDGEQQTFYVVYDLVPDAVQLTFPAFGEVLAPNDNIPVQWDSWGDTRSSYTLEFSPNNGNGWQTISSDAKGTSFDWAVPTVSTNEARLRITRNSDGKTSSTGNFRITGVPSIQLSPTQCPGSIELSWPGIAGATDYDVMWYRNGDMTSAAVQTDTNYIFRNLSEDSIYYVTARARINGLPGRRAIALAIQPNKGDCKSSFHNNDLKPGKLIYPVVGRAFTLKHLGNEVITMQIKNLDDSTSVAGFTVSYSVNGRPWVNEIVNSSIAANGVLDYTFQTPFDFSLPGNYAVRLAVTSAIDNNHGNDTILGTVRHIINSPVPVVTGVRDRSMLPNNITYNANYTGLDSLDRFDYQSGSGTDIMRVGGGIVFEYSTAPGKEKPQSLTATYNLSLFDTAQHTAELNFDYFRSSSPPDAFDSLLVRGSDTSPWILVQDILPPDSPRYINKVVQIPLTAVLKAHGQNFSSSSQARWVPSPNSSVVIMGDVSLLNKTNDVGLISIDSLLPYSCNLSNTTPVRVTVQNNNNTAVNKIPVKYRVNDGNLIAEIISSIPAHTTVSYQFKQTADLSAAKEYKIQAWIENAQDAYASNDSSRITVQNQKLVNAFPYLQDFETGNGDWLTGGTNSSWEYGSPVSRLINGAASGKNAWKTNLDGNYNTSEFSFLYAGCYDFSKLSKPVVSFSLAMNTDSCGAFYCDRMYVLYCANGKDWAVLNARATPVQNWQTFFTSKSYNRWHVVTARLADTFKIVRLRLQFYSDSYSNFEGIGADDFHVYDSTTTIYDGNNTADSHQVTGGRQWVEFRKDNKLFAAIQSGNQDIGDVQVQTYSSGSGVRNFHGQYYLNRNFVFRPSKPLTDSVTIRFYFTDKESDSLLFANTCSNCTLPKNAYKLGVSFYKSDDNNELDSSILNNRKGEWNFIANDRLRIVPFMTGYFVEFKVREAGEFRLSNGGLDGKSDLPVQVSEFAADRLLSTTSLKWTTAQEINIDHFDVEVATGNTAFANDLFQKVGVVKSKGRSTSSQSYSFMDGASNSHGVYYYRLKNVDAFGNYSYSKVLPVVFNEELEWRVFPNPSSGKFKVVYQSTPGNIIEVRVLNSVGSLVKEMRFIATGFVQTQEISLSENYLAAGVYIFKAKTGAAVHVLKLVKQ